MKMKKIIIGTLVIGLILPIHLGYSQNQPIGKNLTKYFFDLEKRASQNQHHVSETVALGVIYNSMIGVGYFLYPEAAEVLYHFCWGNGADIKIDSDYIKNSPVVQKRLAKLSVNEHWSGWYHQTEDIRLSYAYNPIKIEKRKNLIRVSSPIKVAPLGSQVYTKFYLSKLSFKLPDSLMRIGCKSPKNYIAYTEWKR